MQLRIKIVSIVVTCKSDYYIIMAALCIGGHYIFACDFYLSIYLFFPHLISAAAGWMSTIL